jgi:hypothetical protein
MRKCLGVIVAVGALAWSGAAYAVVDVDSVPTTAAGQETPGQTVAIKVKDEQGKTMPCAHRLAASLQHQIDVELDVDNGETSKVGKLLVTY